MSSPRLSELRHLRVALNGPVQLWLEGPDGVGKTTLAQAYREAYPGRLIHDRLGWLTNKVYREWLPGFDWQAHGKAPKVPPQPEVVNGCVVLLLDYKRDHINDMREEGYVVGDEVALGAYPSPEVAYQELNNSYYRVVYEDGRYYLPRVLVTEFSYADSRYVPSTWLTPQINEAIPQEVLDLLALYKEGC